MVLTKNANALFHLTLMVFGHDHVFYSHDHIRSFFAKVKQNLGSLWTKWIHFDSYGICESHWKMMLVTVAAVLWTLSVKLWWMHKTIPVFNCNSKHFRISIEKPSVRTGTFIECAHIECDIKFDVSNEEHTIHHWNAFFVASLILTARGYKS